MSVISEFVHPKLKPILEGFADDVESKGISKAAINLQRKVIGVHAAGVSDGLINTYGVQKEDADFFMQECGRIMSENYSSIMPVADKKAMLSISHDTDLTTSVKNELCMSLAREAVASGNMQLLHAACIDKSGISLQDLGTIKEDISRVFGEKEYLCIESVTKMKESPEQAVSDLVKSLSTGEMTTSGYVEFLAILGKEVPEPYLSSSGFILSTEETADGFAVVLNMDGMDNMPAGTVYISDEEQNDPEKGLSMKKEDAIQIVQGYGIHGDNVMDCIAEANIPPENPNFVSEMEQKFANFVSAQAMPSMQVKSEEIKLSSVLPDDMRETFLAARNDMQYEREEQLADDASVYDYDHDGVPDVYSEQEETEEQEEADL